MKDILKFFNDCGCFYVITVDKDKPSARPFGVIMGDDDFLYLATGPKKSVYQQIVDNPNIQLLALKSQTMDWMRVNGKAEVCDDIDIKTKMYNECPILSNHYTSAEDENFALIKISHVSVLPHM